MLIGVKYPIGLVGYKRFQPPINIVCEYVSRPPETHYRHNPGRPKMQKMHFI